MYIAANVCCVLFNDSSWYTTARKIAPKNGRPYNQLAVLAFCTVITPSYIGLFVLFKPLAYITHYLILIKIDRNMDIKVTSSSAVA